MNEGGGRVPLSAARGHYKGTCTLTLRETCVFARAFPQHKGNVQSEEGGKKKSANHGTEESMGSLSPQMCVRFRG